MNPITISILSAAVIFAGALLGMRLQLLLPSHHFSKEMQDLVKLSAGTIATLTALVLGLLVSSAKSSFDAINSGIVQGSAHLIFFDRTLARYGPETQDVRGQLKRTVAAGIQNAWPDAISGSRGLASVEKGRGFDVVQDMLSAILPQTDVQRAILSQAQGLSTNLAESRWLLIEQTHSQLPPLLLIILIFWMVLLFVSFGMFAPRNTMARVVLAVGAAAISAAIFLVLELNEPFDGVIRVSSAPMRNALQHLGE
jgi:hypothetical protein